MKYSTESYKKTNFIMSRKLYYYKYFNKYLCLTLIFVVQKIISHISEIKNIKLRRLLKVILLKMPVLYSL